MQNCNTKYYILFVLILIIHIKLQYFILQHKQYSIYARFKHLYALRSIETDTILFYFTRFKLR